MKHDVLSQNSRKLSVESGILILFEIFYPSDSIFTVVDSELVSSHLSVEVSCKIM